MKSKKLLIAGMPGTGKTTVGNLLENKGFVHVDMEEGHRTSRILDNLDRFIDTELLKDSNVVLSWGFSPDEETLECLRNLQNIGFEVFWFEGDVAYSRAHCMKRHGYEKEVFDEQVKLLEKWNVPEIVNAKRINVFDENGKFLTAEILLDKIGIR